jgi:hypothetical protein
MSRYTSCHIVCYQKCRYFFINKKKDRVKKNILLQLNQFGKQINLENIFQQENLNYCVN